MTAKKRFPVISELTGETHPQLKVLAALAKMSMGAYMARLLEKHLEEDSLAQKLAKAMKEGGEE